MAIIQKQELIIPDLPGIDEIARAIQEGLNTTENFPPTGCGFVYVKIFYSHPDYLEDEEIQRIYKRQMLVHLMPKIELASQIAGKRYMVKASSVKHAIYIGMDNNTGRELAQGEAVATNLKAIGIRAAMIPVGD
ncbi:hypothetical protein [Nodosilinea nodulosa]|uniref:hypothetical protein n=1 Tax=Nodosilinea nodulosa TaxID=416001 RepID=UPI0002D25C95|nr:hypothetical protein [Nodosilinea nodulosa]